MIIKFKKLNSPFSSRREIEISGSKWSLKDLDRLGSALLSLATSTELEVVHLFPLGEEIVLENKKYRVAVRPCDADELRQWRELVLILGAIRPDVGEVLKFLPVPPTHVVGWEKKAPPPPPKQEEPSSDEELVEVIEP